MTYGPPAPLMPNLEIMMSNEVDTYLRVVLEAETADRAAALWRPGPSRTSQLKHLQQEPMHAKGNKGNHGGFKGRGWVSRRG